MYDNIKVYIEGLTGVQIYLLLKKDVGFKNVGHIEEDYAKLFFTNIKSAKKAIKEYCKNSDYFVDEVSFNEENNEYQLYLKTTFIRGNPDLSFIRLQERELAIKTEENQQAIEMVKRTNALKLAEADREIELTRARTLRDQNAITSQGLSDKLLAYKALDVQAKMAENKAAIFVPYESLNSPGLSNRIFNNK